MYAKTAKKHADFPSTPVPTHPIPHSARAREHHLKLFSFHMPPGQIPHFTVRSKYQNKKQIDPSSFLHDRHLGKHLGRNGKGTRVVYKKQEIAKTGQRPAHRIHKEYKE